MLSVTVAGYYMLQVIQDPTHFPDRYRMDWLRPWEQATQFTLGAKHSRFIWVVCEILCRH